jgi:hypothetical protein
MASKFADLPPLKNPPMLEGIDDLSNLSYLHEYAHIHFLSIWGIENCRNLGPLFSTMSGSGISRKTSTLTRESF